ncbi:hypothetical protein NM208_g9265 [Fusarium decemcellulare]|uniref:Uncharacterized protein n=1 Tax=Fusarium decemcellulare TaxID=57161 RepID=A0ACC1S267_9HYPO|nr:hypothetical protein NM208_g9265 [Fusarium decemcellulare]
MSYNNTEKQASITVAEEVKPLQPQTVRDKIKFAREEKKTRLFCYRVAASSGDVTGADDGQTGQWCDRAGALQFLEDPWSEKRGENGAPLGPSFTLIGGLGNGTFHPLSLDRDIFTKITRVLHLPDRIRKVIGSIHGVFSRFVEYDDDDKPKSLLILLSTSKAPVREIFCALRIVPSLESVTCLLFDDQEADLRRVIDLVRDSTAGLAWKNPVAFLSILLKECGRTSELKRGPLDLNLLGAEILTKSTPWKKKLQSTPNDFLKTTGQLNVTYNNLLFVARAVDAEIDAWQFLRQMATDELLGPWLRGEASKREWNEVLDDIDFEMAHTQSRKAQIGCLKERMGIQVNVISNLIAHQESSQTNLIAVVALIFAPASLIASIFSAGIFVTNDRSWVAYVASTLPVTAMILMGGLYFLQLQILMRLWQTMRSLIGLEGNRRRETDVEDFRT